MSIFTKSVGVIWTKCPDGGLGDFTVGRICESAWVWCTETGIELFGEGDGIVPTPAWKRRNVGENWSTGDTYIATIGQGYVLATPIQVLIILCNDRK